MADQHSKMAATIIGSMVHQFLAIAYHLLFNMSPVDLFKINLYLIILQIYLDELSC